MYLLVGGTGLLGGRVAVHMRAASLPVRALVRPTSSAATLATIGAEVCWGDLVDVASLDTALRGVHTVVTTANAMARSLAGDASVSIHDVDHLGNRNLVDAAERAGVRRFVFVSAEREELEADTPFTDAKLETEAHLRGATFRSVIVRPDAFQEVWLSPAVGVDLPHDEVRVYGQGHAHRPFVAVDDVATAIVTLATMDEPPHEAVLAGPESVSMDDIVAMWHELTGREVHVSHIPRPALAVGSRILRPFKPALASTMGMALHADRTESNATPSTLRSLGIEPRPVRAYLQELAQGSAVPA